MTQYYRCWQNQGNTIAIDWCQEYYPVSVHCTVINFITRRLTMSHPEIHVKDWIDVGNSECVVQRLLPPGSPSGVCIVVLNKTKPTTRIVGWDGKNGTSCPAVTMAVMQMIMIPVFVN